ncbi:hypothetical protein D9M69_536160 [compost metagenome]
MSCRTTSSCASDEPAGNVTLVEMKPWSSTGRKEVGSFWNSSTTPPMSKANTSSTRLPRTSSLPTTPW